MQRIFLGADRPSLHAAVDWLVGRYGGGATLDLSGVRVVTPGAAAARRLIELLLEKATTGRLAFLRPGACTVGIAPELLYRPKQPFAGDLTQRLAWRAALKSLDEAAITAITPRPPQSEEGWWNLAALAQQRHRELAAETMDFGDVADVLPSLGLPQEAVRWRALAAAQRKYLDTLDRLNLWDMQTARLVAIRNRECHTDRDIVLLGCVDINRELADMLDQVSDRVTALICGPEEWADRFDPYGRLVSEKWSDATIPLREESLLVADDFADQATEVTRWVSGLATEQGKEPPAVDDVAVSVSSDERLAPHLSHAMIEAGAGTQFATGEPMSQTRPYRLLTAVAECLHTGEMGELAALIRHPDMADRIDRALIAWLSEKAFDEGDHPAKRKPAPDAPIDWLSTIDDLRRMKLPPTVSAANAVAGGLAGKVIGIVREILQPLTRPRPLAEWGEPLLALLREVYDGVELDDNDPAGRRVLRGCAAIRAAIVNELMAAPPELGDRFTAAEAIRFTLEACAHDRVPPLPGPPAVRLIGWLDLPLDDAPVAVVTSANEGVIPASVNADPLMPGRLRAALGLRDNDSRYARDAYALSLIAATKSAYAVVFARRDADGLPLSPSRLLLADDADVIARRCRRFFAERPAPRPLPPETPDHDAAPPTPAPFRFLKPDKARALAKITSLPATQFKRYLQCPYRFYLERVEGLGAVGDDAQEMDPMQYGILLHEALSRFGKGDRRDSALADELKGEFRAMLDLARKEILGDAESPALRVQLEHARRRLEVLAEKQAARAAQGWRIKFQEHEFKPGEATLDVDGTPFSIHGKIDRIDFNENTGEWAILDYKTGEKATDPDKAHRKGRGEKEWIDLQLPLYRLMARSLGVTGNVRLGYILLPKSVEDTGFRIADWTDEELAAADEAARQVIREIRQGVFWPPEPAANPAWDDFGWLCYEGVFDPPPPPEG